MPVLDNAETLLAVIESLPVGISVVDPEGHIVLWNRRAERLTGFFRQEVIGRSVREGFLGCVDAENNELAGNEAAAARALRDRKDVNIEASLRHRSGHRVPMRIRASVLHNEKGAAIGAVESFEETIAASDWERRQNKLASYGCLDRGSGVLNHGMMQTHLREMVSTFAEHQVPFSVACIALDQMDTIKSRHGPGALAAVVRTVAQTLELSLRPTDSVGRWQENEFLAILQECTAEEARKTGERLRKMAAMARIEWWGDLLPITLSIGATEVRTGDSTDSMMERAELSLRACRERGGNGILVAAEE